ncbi:MAG TPA: cell wall hydrolase [Caulobacteraceae bacterium]|nr:cell wall hydrolase [Caulobacteraceae bacterium]
MQFDLSRALALSAVTVWAGASAAGGATGASLGGAAPEAAEATPYGEDRAQAVQCLTQAIYYEAASEPLQGRESVAQVVLNRLRSPAYPKTVCGVVFQGAGGASGCQFTFACDGSMGRRPEPRLWSEAQSIAETVLDGQVPSYVGDATHYHAVYVSPPWRASMIETTRIGAHIFYRQPDSAGRRSAVASEPRPAPPPRPRPSTFSPWGLQIATIVPPGAAAPNSGSETAVGRGLGE